MQCEMSQIQSRERRDETNGVVEKQCHGGLGY
jgi:hypothetical protein